MLRVGMAKNYRRSWRAVPGWLVQQTLQLAGGTSEIEVHRHYCLRQDAHGRQAGILGVGSGIGPSPAEIGILPGTISEKIPGIEKGAS